MMAAGDVLGVVLLVAVGLVGVAVRIMAWWYGPTRRRRW